MSSLEDLCAPSTGLLKARGINAPSFDRVAAVSKKHGLDCSEEELKDYKKCTDALLDSFRTIANLSEPIPRVKYPRTPGHRPKPEDNPYNAWAWKCDIPGASTGKLAGKTVVIKDSVMVAGVPMRNGSQLLEGYVPDFDATVVTRILDAGGRIVGKSSCENLCLSGSSITSCSGPVRNPYNEKYVAGGSSSGSAALLYGGQVDLAIGTDQGGSIRCPACCSGCVGLKPTFGLVPYTGAASILYDLDYVGPMAQSVQDCALLLDVIAGYDPLDSRMHRGAKASNYTEELAGNINKLLKGAKIGIVDEGFIDANKEVEKVVIDAVMATKIGGATVDRISIPEHADAAELCVSLLQNGEGEAMFRLQATSIGYRSYNASSLDAAFHKGFRTSAAYLSHTAKFPLLTSAYVREEFGLHFYCKGKNIMNEITKKYDEALERYDVIVMPTINHLPPKIPTEDVSIPEYVRITTAGLKNTTPFNFTGHPALSINAGFSKENHLPIGVMIIGKHFDEVTVFKIARGFERIRDDTVLRKSFVYS